MYQPQVFASFTLTLKPSIVLNAMAILALLCMEGATITYRWRCLLFSSQAIFPAGSHGFFFLSPQPSHTCLAKPQCHVYSPSLTPPFTVPMPCLAHPSHPLLYGAHPPHLVEHAMPPTMIVLSLGRCAGTSCHGIWWWLSPFQISGLSLIRVCTKGPLCYLAHGSHVPS